MSYLPYTAYAIRAAGLACALALLTNVSLARAARGPADVRDVAGDFSALAQQRPWACGVADEAVPETGWTASPPMCAWQGRLRMRRWSGPPMAGNTCISAQAAWWYWTRGKNALPVWQAGWPSHAMHDEAGGERRLVLIEKLSSGDWRASEWHWSPSPRKATRTWQQGRWDALLAHVAQFRQSIVVSGTREEQLLRQVLAANVGQRPAERDGNVLKWQTDGMCLTVDAAAPGLQQLQLPYQADDSRLEQRAAMQLQLARRYPKATWVSPFNLLPAAPKSRGGAKFYALWIESGVLKGQLWIPTKGDGPLVRVRIATSLPGTVADPADNPALALRRQVIERELMGVAARWSLAND